MKGAFITIEGVEGCGKSTQVIGLKHYLESMDYVVEVTREPGGTSAGEAIRAVLLDSAQKDLSPTAELLLYAAARAQHVDQRIRPALEAGRIVLCDRFADSTTAYQGAGRAIDPADLEELHRLATRGVWPDLTIVIDLPVAQGLARAAQVHEPDRLEREPLAFHERVRQGFLQIAQREPGRVKVVDGSASIPDVAEAIQHLVDGFLDSRT
ncbi:MAG: dTMP kinase [Candidatus Hydrogenedentes bacterium]|nr:dTMP kinase [Candidatus Hydrogenedentota bacterium]